MAWDHRRRFLKHGHGGHDLTRCAVTALKSVAIHEGGLHGVKGFSVRQTFDRSDFIALMRHRERQTGKCPASIDMDRARPALALVTTLLAPSQIQVFAQRVQQSGAGIDLQYSAFPVDLKIDPNRGSIRSLSCLA